MLTNLLRIAALAWTLALAPAATPPQDTGTTPEEGVQVGDQEPAEDGAASTNSETTDRALKKLHESIRLKESELARWPGNDASEMSTEEIDAGRRTLSTELIELKADFQSISTGIDIEEFLSPAAQSFDLKAELEKLVRPLLEELKDATRTPRQIEDSRTKLETAEGKRNQADQALRKLRERIDALVTEEDREYRSYLESNLRGWEEEQERYKTEAELASALLEDRLNAQTSVWESSREVLTEFFRTRGWNLLLALLTFLVVFFGLRAAYRTVVRAFPVRGAHRPMHRRLIEVIVHTFAGVAALGASLIVLSAAGDWVLLGIVLLFIVGIAWASKMAIPRYLAEMRLLLNLGTVREAERVVYDGLPYRVSRLGIQTHLTNPALEGGYVRLPLGDLIEMRSRPIAPGDLWFPCRLGDFVLLSDGQRGEVVKLTPELVRIALLGGSEVTYTTPDFLSLSPENISRDFRLSVTFGIDYDHQPIATTQVAPKMQAALEQGLGELVGPDDIKSLVVEFKEAAASSLDYAILIDFSGDVAARYARLNRAIQRILVDLCNVEGWTIPFTQIVVHQPGSGA